MDLCIEHISKRFKDMTAVDDISLSLTLVSGDCWVPTAREKPP